MINRNKSNIGTDILGVVLVSIATFLLLSLFWKNQYSIWIYESGTIIGIILLLTLSVGIFRMGDY